MSVQSWQNPLRSTQIATTFFKHARTSQPLKGGNQGMYSWLAHVSMIMQAAAEPSVPIMLRCCSARRVRRSLRSPMAPVGI